MAQTQGAIRFRRHYQRRRSGLVVLPIEVEDRACGSSYSACHADDLKTDIQLAPANVRFLGVKGTCVFAAQMSAFDPKRTLSGRFQHCSLIRYDGLS